MNELLKSCSRCGKQYPSTDFSKHSAQCKPCKAEFQRNWRNKNRLRWRAWARENYKRRGWRLAKNGNLRKYGITLSQYEVLLEAQKFRCAICRTDKPNGKGNFFVVDHDHSTGRIRGLLCNFCNSGIGYFRENIDSFAKAISYLRGES